MNKIKDILINDLSGLCRLWRRLSLEQVKKSGITFEQRWILLHLNKHNSVTVGKLADILGTTQSSVTLITKKMENKNLLERVRGIPDDRTVTLRITEDGKNLLNDWEEKRREMFSKYLSVMDEVDLNKLHELLSKILDEYEKISKEECKNDKDR
ncbi:winged helix-turn-helix transcriptional regulator [bacterium]|nr:winged helix-turn-helix transcriptional regulator [bacterium]